MPTMYREIIILLSIGLITAIPVFANTETLPSYVEHNQALVSFDVSMPIDATGYTLQGKNLTGGYIRFSDNGVYISPLLAYETGQFKTPTVTNLQNKPLIKTTVNYNAIKFINPNGIDNLFIKIGTAKRTQVVSDLDPYVLKDGKYTWQVAFFAFGKESDTVQHNSNNVQFIQINSNPDYPAKSNEMYTQQFYLYSKGNSDIPIVAHPIRSDLSDTVLAKPYSEHFQCKADGIWGSGNPDRTIKGNCSGRTMVYPAGPNLDYEYGSFKLPKVHSPWTTTLPTDHAVFPDKTIRKGYTNISIATSFHYVAQKIRVPLNDNVTLFAEFGTAYRNIIPNNLRYQCNMNIYLKNILPKADCLKKSYLPGGASYTYFSVGYTVRDKQGTRYTARYMHIPEAENQNRLAWRDASETGVYAISTSKKKPLAVVRKNLNDALHIIEQHPKLYDVLGKHFFIKILKKNHLYR